MKSAAAPVFPLPAAKIIGPSGHLIAIDPVADFVARVAEKVHAAGLNNVELLCRDTLNTGLDDANINSALLFDVIPLPSLPLNRLLPEMHRVLKPDGTLAVWLFPTTAGVPTAILRSGLFRGLGKKHGVYSYIRSQMRQ